MYHKDLQVWQRSIAFVTDIYKILEGFPKTELYSLVDQIKRASISIPSNIAEWSARSTEKEQLHFLHIARGSTAEIDTQCIIAKNLGYISEEDYRKVNEELSIIWKMLTKLIHSLQKSSNP